MYDRPSTYNVSEAKLPYTKQKLPRLVFWEKNLKICAIWYHIYVIATALQLVLGLTAAHKYKSSAPINEIIQKFIQICGYPHFKNALSLAVLSYNIRLISRPNKVFLTLVVYRRLECYIIGLIFMSIDCFLDINHTFFFPSFKLRAFQR